MFTGEAPAPVGPRVTHEPGLFAAFTLEQWLSVLKLEQRTANFGGKPVPVPRLEAWYGLRSYAFGGRVWEPLPWPDLLLGLRRSVEERVGRAFDSCFANFYRDGMDTIPWHADDQAWIGPVVASVTFGGPRRFDMKRKRGDMHNVWSWDLGHGDLFVMHEGTQEEWLHGVARVPNKKVRPRLNFTFRSTVPA